MTDDALIKLAENELEPLVAELRKDRSTSQNIYTDDLLTNHEPECISLNDLLAQEFPPNSWVVDKLIPNNGITCISGRPKVGKSLFTLYLAICLTTQNKFLGEFEVEKQEGVLLISKEDPPRLIQERMKVFTHSTDLPIYFCTDNQLFLDTDKYIKWLQGIIKEKRIKVVIIDSFRRIFHGEENSSQVVSEVHNRFKALLDCGITIIFVHHHGKEGYFKKVLSDKLRGSSDILAMLDSLLILEQKNGKDNKKSIIMTQECLRNDEPIQPCLLEFPNFDGDNPAFKFLNYLDIEEDKQSNAEDDILNVCADGEKRNQTTIITLLKQSNKEYGVTTIKNALRSLEISKSLDSKKEGKQKLLWLANEKNESTSQSYIQNDLLTGGNAESVSY